MGSECAFAIDMAEPKTIAKIDTYRRRGNTNSKTVEYYIGNNPAVDDASWAKIANGVFAGGDLLSLPLSEPATGRYLKIYLPDSNSEPHISIAEIVVFGTE